MTGHTGVINAVAATPDGRWVVKVWELRREIELRSLTHTGPVQDVAVTPDGNRVIAAGEDRALRVWDPTTGEPVRALGRHDGRVSAVAVTHGGRRVIAASRSALKVRDLDSGGDLGTLAGHDGEATAVAMASAGRRAVCASLDQALRAWDLDRRSVLRHFQSLKPAWEPPWRPAGRPWPPVTSPVGYTFCAGKPPRPFSAAPAATSCRCSAAR